MSMQEPIQVTAFDKSLTLSEWSNETGIPRTTIQYRLRSGMPPEVALSTDEQVLHEWRHPHLAQRQKKALEVFRKTKSISKTADRLGVAPRTIQRYLQEHGIFLRDTYRKQKRRAWNMYQQGASPPEIARKLGKHSSTIRGYIREAAVNPALQIMDEWGYCDCGAQSTICVKIRVGQGAKQVLELCAEHYEMFLEDEG